MMMYCRKIFILMVFVLGSFSINAKLPEQYNTLPNEQKQDALWDEINKSHLENQLPVLSSGGFWEALNKLKGLFNLSPTFDHAGDEVPNGRVKILHANGVVGKIYFKPASGHPFTGVYQSGGIGLVRLSMTAPASDTSFIPGMAIKILVLNHPSVNLHVMNRLEGQEGNWNFFAKDFSNQIEHPQTWTLKAIEKIFEWTRSPANDLPIDHLAYWNDKGEVITPPISPERLYFRPSETVKNVIPAASREDFRVSLSHINVGPLYEVYGEYKGAEYYIGTLMLESTLLASDYGDKQLFFQHQR
jgi:hypothetical protein